MLTWRAGSQTQAQVRAWFGANGTGMLDLFERKSGKFVLVAGSADPGAALQAPISPEAGEVRFCVRAFVANIAGEAQPVYLELSQDGRVLPAESADGQANGSGPFSEVRFSPDAPHNEPIFYYFNVSFSS